VKCTLAWTPSSAMVEITSRQSVDEVMCPVHSGLGKEDRMFAALSSVEIGRQHAELLAARTVLSLFSTGLIDGSLNNAHAADQSNVLGALINSVLPDSQANNGPTG
jgi:hypothetical protein